MISAARLVRLVAAQRILYWFAGLAALAAGAGSVPAMELHALPRPPEFPGAESAWIAEHWALNGLPISIRWFSAPAPAEEVLRFYADTWRGHGWRRTSRSRYRSMQSLGVESDGFYYSVQARDVAAGSEGFIVVSKAPGHATEDRSTRFPTAPGDRVLQKIEAIDLGVRSESLIVESTHSPEMALSAYRTALMREQWVAVIPHSQPGGGNPPAWFQKGAQHCQITVLGDDAGPGARLLIHWVKDSHERK